MTLIELAELMAFLRARLAEEETRLAEFEMGNPRSKGTGPADGADMWSDARWHGLGLVGYSAERIRVSIDVRRRILDGLDEAVGMNAEVPMPEGEGYIHALAWGVRLLAEEYESHPGYRPGWRVPR